MSEPIISPWIFYWIEVFDIIHGIAGFFGVMFIAILLFGLITYPDAVDKKEWRKFLCYVCVGLAFFGLLVLFVPTSETSYKMLVASYITPDNIDKGVELTKDGIQFIMQTIVDTAKQLKGL